jgi:hypothetical protein
VIFFQHRNKDPARNILVHVTRSPWLVDGHAIKERINLGPDQNGNNYFLYYAGTDLNGRRMIRCMKGMGQKEDTYSKKLEHVENLEHAYIHANYTTRPVAYALEKWLKEKNPSLVVTVVERPVYVLPQYGFHDLMVPWRGLLVAHETDDQVIDPFDPAKQVTPLSD